MVQILNATGTDVRAICSIANSVLPDFFTQDQLASRLGKPEYLILAAKADGATIGFCISRILPTYSALYGQGDLVAEVLGCSSLPVTTGLILSAGVLAKYSRAGVGTALYHESQNFFNANLDGKSNRFIATYVWPNGTSSGLIKKMGFIHIDNWVGNRFEDGSMEQLYCKLEPV